MKDIFIGIVIVMCCFLVIDFVYASQNTCVVYNNNIPEEAKCGIIKNSTDAEIYIFGRYW